MLTERPATSLCFVACLPLPLKVAAAREKCNALVHDCLAHPQVVVQPLLHARCVAELLRLYTGTVLALACLVRVHQVMYEVMYEVLCGACGSLHGCRSMCGGVYKSEGLDGVHCRYGAWGS